MADRAVGIAALFMQMKGKPWPDIQAAMVADFSDASQEEVMRGAALAEEVLLADAAESQVEVDAIKAELERRRSINGGNADE